MSNHQQPVTRAALLFAALATLAACGERQQAEREAQPGAEPQEQRLAAATEARAERPLSLDLGTENVEISITLPEAAGQDPALYDRLVMQAEAEAEESRQIADEDADLRKGTDIRFNPHFLDIRWEASFQNARVASLLKTTALFQGGAHPNSYFDSLLWLLDEHRPVQIDEMIRGQAAWEAISAAAEAAIMEEKRARLGGDLSDEQYWLEDVRRATAPQPDNFEPFTLVPSATDPQKAGGLKLHYPPYALGAYAEGSYEALIPQSVFAEHVTPEWADLFGGEPAPN